MYDFHIFFNFCPVILCNRNNEKEERNTWVRTPAHLSTLCSILFLLVFVLFLFSFSSLTLKQGRKGCQALSLPIIEAPKWYGAQPSRITQNQAVPSNSVMKDWFAPVQIKYHMRLQSVLFVVGKVRCSPNWAIWNDVVYNALSNFLCNTMWNHIQQITSFNHLSFLLQFSFLACYWQPNRSYAQRSSSGLLQYFSCCMGTIAYLVFPL